MFWTRNIERLSIFIGGASIGILSTYFIVGTSIGMTSYQTLARRDLIYNDYDNSDIKTNYDSHLIKRNEKQEDLLKYGYPGPISDSISRDAYMGSYNRQLRNPNFVIEVLTEAKLNQTGADRDKSKFKEDDSIPKLFRGLLKDYSKSGYDRGHMAPAGDVKYSQSAMDETFYLTNMAPQVGVGFNRHYWAYLEEFCRGLTKQFDKVYVITGPLYLPKKGDGFPDKEKWYVQYEVIGNPPNIAVPTHFFKVLLVMPKEGGNPYLAGFLLPNAKIPEDEPLVKFSTSIESIEKASGLIFFDKLGPNKETENSKLCDKITCKFTSKFGES